ncbi:MAG TPA: glucoamylase family protein [Acholeplasma sp.]|nr:glucoamylase family protein [Acholeplasma sp.]
MTENQIELIKDIQETAFNLLKDLTNYNENEPGYGLTLDHNETNVASIAATGFLLSGYVIAVKYGYMSYEEALDKVTKTLHTLAYNVPEYKGFFVHFVDFHQATISKKSEYSTVDTMLCLCGVITVAEFFKEEMVQELSNLILNRVDWLHFVHTHEGKQRFYMAYNPMKNGAYVQGKPGFIFQWHMLAEQIPMYLIAAGSNQLNKRLANDLYEGFERVLGTYKDVSYYISPGNTIFVYQYPLCWMDGKTWVDKFNFSWFENLRLATIGHKLWNLDNYHLYKTFSKHTFGLTASSTPTGYGVFHCLPNAFNEVITDGTVAPNGMIGSLITNSEDVIEAITYMKELPHVWGKYGFIDAYNFEGEKPWYSTRYITIDKGLELLAANAYLSKDVVECFMNHPMIKKGLEVLEWKKI